MIESQNGSHTTAAESSSQELEDRVRALEKEAASLREELSRSNEQRQQYRDGLFAVLDSPPLTEEELQELLTNATDGRDLLRDLKMKLGSGDGR